MFPRPGINRVYTPPGDCLLSRGLQCKGDRHSRPGQPCSGRCATCITLHKSRILRVTNSALSIYRGWVLCIQTLVGRVQARHPVYPVTAVFPGRELFKTMPPGNGSGSEFANPPAPVPVILLPPQMRGESNRYLKEIPVSWRKLPLMPRTSETEKYPRYSALETKHLYERGQQPG